MPLSYLIVIACLVVIVATLCLMASCKRDDRAIDRLLEMRGKPQDGKTQDAREEEAAP